jgi:HPt (histidine-containing phosphotransfer) domain-containing protein
MGGTSAETRRNLIEAYLEQGDAWIPELTAAAESGDLDRIRVITHTLGSSSALLGAQPLADLLTEAGRIARTEGADLVPAVTAARDEYRMVSMVLSANQEALTDPVESVG